MLATVFGTTYATYQESMVWCIFVCTNIVIEYLSSVLRMDLLSLVIPLFAQPYITTSDFFEKLMPEAVSECVNSLYSCSLLMNSSFDVFNKQKNVFLTII